MGAPSTLDQASAAELEAGRKLARALWRDSELTLPQIAARLGLERWEVAELIVGDHPAVAPRSTKGKEALAYRRRLMALLARQLQQAAPSRRGATPQIAKRLGVARRTVDDYLYDPDRRLRRQWLQARAGTCRVCGEPTSYRGTGRSAPTCFRHRSNPNTWTRETAIEALRAWQATYGFRPTSSDLDRTRARQRGVEALERLDRLRMPNPATLRRLFGSATAALDAAFAETPPGQQPHRP